MDSQKEYSELIELIDLSEKVSDKVATYKQKIRRTCISLFLIIVSSIMLFCLYIPLTEYGAWGYHYRDFISLIVIIASMFLILFLISLLMRIQKIGKELKSESNILHNLLVLTDSVKQSISFNLSNVEKAIIDMRLSRIKFSKSNFSFFY